MISLTVLVIINRDKEDIKIRFEIFNAFKFNIEVSDKKDKKLKKNNKKNNNA